MLIGIRRQFRLENDSYFAPSYRAQVLLIGDGLMRTSRQLNLMTLSDQLVAFKEEFDENEKNLVSICYIPIFLINFIFRHRISWSKLV